MVVTDNAREYIMGEAKELFDSHGITLMPTTPHNPEENSLAERVNDTIKSVSYTHLTLPTTSRV